MKGQYFDSGSKEANNDDRNQQGATKQTDIGAHTSVELVQLVRDDIHTMIFVFLELYKR